MAENKKTDKVGKTTPAPKGKVVETPVAPKGVPSQRDDSGEPSAEEKERRIKAEDVAPVGESKEAPSGGRGENRDGRFRRRRKTPEELTEEKLAAWIPKTSLGKSVLKKEIKNIDEILDKKITILEDEIVDALLPTQNDLLFTGQSKGKFGGGKRRAWRQSQKKTKEGNVITFSAMAVVGDKNGHVGLGLGKAKETLPSREKALRKAKLSIMKVKRGSGSFEGSSAEPHSIPHKVEGKCGSCKITLLPAPQGTGLVIGREGKRILRLAGIKDIYSKSFGQTRTTINYARAIIDALGKLR